MSDAVLFEVRDRIADVRLNRPHRHNALNDDLFAALIEAGDRIAADPTIRAVVISGEGPGFCAGLDISTFDSVSRGGDWRPPTLATREGRELMRGQRLVWGFSSLPIPVVAAVHGAAIGAGCQIALHADLRIVHPGAKLSLKEIDWGLSPDMGGTQILPRLIGAERSKYMIFTGATVTGAEAVAMGMALETSFDPRATALELAAKIAARNPDAIRNSKELVDLAATLDLHDGFDAERAVVGRTLASANQSEATRARLEKREPDFADPEAAA